MAHTKPCCVSLMTRSPRRRRTRTDSCFDHRLVAQRVVGVDRDQPALGLRHDLLGHDDDVAVEQLARRSAISAGELVARPDLGHALDGEDLESRHRSTAALSTVTRAERRRDLGAAHDGRGHDAPHALGLDVGRQGGVGLVDHQRRRPRRRRAGPRRPPTPRGRARAASGRPGPSGRRRRRSATPRPRSRRRGRDRLRARRARPGPGRSTRSGSTGR